MVLFPSEPEGSELEGLSIRGSWLEDVVFACNVVMLRSIFFEKDSPAEHTGAVEGLDDWAVEGFEREIPVIGVHMAFCTKKNIVRNSDRIENDTE